MNYHMPPDDIPPSEKPQTPDYETTVESIEALASLMDSQFQLPGTKINLGLDTIIGLIPGIGDTVGLGVAGYIVMRGAQMGVPKHKLAGMGANIFVDWLIGTIPIIGDLFDVGWKANNRNARIIREHYEENLRTEIIPPEGKNSFKNLT